MTSLSLLVGFLIMGGAITVLVVSSTEDPPPPPQPDDDSGSEPETILIGHQSSLHAHAPPTLQVLNLTWNLSMGPAVLKGAVQHDHPNEIAVQLTAEASNGTRSAPVVVNATAGGEWSWAAPIVIASNWTIEVIAMHPPDSTQSQVALVSLVLTDEHPTNGSNEEVEAGNESVEGDGNGSDDSTPLFEECLGGHAAFALHIHPNLFIISDGVQIEIPTNVGIDTTICPNGMHVVHTHDSSGRLHVESHQAVDVPLGVFFEIWGWPFNATHVMDWEIGENHSVNISVDGVLVDTWEETILADGQTIVIEHVTLESDNHDDGNGGSGNGTNGTVDPPDGGGNQSNRTVYDVSDLAQFWIDFFRCQDGDSPGIDDYNTTGHDGHVCSISVSTNDTHVVITSNGIPEHDLESGPGCCTSEQDYEWAIPRSPSNDTIGGHDPAECPEAAGEYECAPDRGPVAIALDGVPIYGPEDGPGGDAVANHHGAYEEDRQHVWLGVCHGHSGPGGTYHYHADANCIHWHPNTDVGEVMLDYEILNSTNNGNHSEVVGVAFDGYPIYGVWGWDDNGDVVEMRSSYRLKAGETGYNGIDDYEFVVGFGHLDVCNGHWGPTPDFPEGIYHYHSTMANGDDDMGFPYFLLCYHGEADMGNSDAGGDADCSGHGETWGPGIGPPPPGCEGGPGGGGPGTTAMAVADSVGATSRSGTVQAAILGSLGCVLLHQALIRSRDRLG